VVPLRSFLIEVIQVGLRRSAPATTLDVLKEGVAQYCAHQEIQLEPKMIEILSVCVFSRREELRRVMTELVFQRSVDRHLVDYNFNIEVTPSSQPLIFTSFL
jgi:hypothetical protein